MPWTFTDERPIWSQISDIVTTRIINGEYSVGGQIPSVRALSEEAGVNPNTIQKAMGELERTKIIETRRTSGRFVTNDEEIINKRRETLAFEKIERFMNSMKYIGYTKEEIISLINKWEQEE